MSGARSQGVSVSRVRQERKRKLWRQAVSRNIASIRRSRAGRSVTSATGASRDSVPGLCLGAGNDMSFIARPMLDALGMPPVMTRLCAWRTPARKRGRGMNAPVRAKAKEPGPPGNTVNVIAPGCIATELTRGSQEITFHSVSCRQTPVGRWGEAAEVG